MPWSSLVSNQTVTFTNLQDAVTSGVFTLKSTITSTNECITKTDANTFVNIDTAYSPYANKTSGQLVVKSDLRPAFLYSYNILYLNANDGYQGSATAANACTHTLSLTLYSHNSTFTAGTRLWYIDGTEFTPADATNFPYYKYSNSTFTYTVGSGVANIASCSTVVTFTTTQTWSKPAGVTTLTVECWGGGGAGGSASSSGARGGGGAGGAYARKVLTGLPSGATNYTVTVGASQTNNGSSGNGSWFSTSGTVFAQGGAGGTNQSSAGNGAGGTGSAASSIGDVVYAGGNGGTGVALSGAGGGGAGSTGAGGNANVSTAGTGTSENGGNGGGGNSAGSPGSAGQNYGGGGSGGNANNNNTRNGGAGAQGFVRITY